MAQRTISTRYLPIAVTVPPGTQPLTPTSTVLNFGDVMLNDVRVFIPSGHAGLTGIAFQLAGTRVIPFGGPNDWILGDLVDEIFDAGFEVDQGFTAVTYNTDVFPHTFRLRLKITDIDAGTSPVIGATPVALSIVPNLVP